MYFDISFLFIFKEHFSLFTSSCKMSTMSSVDKLKSARKLNSPTCVRGHQHTDDGLVVCELEDSVVVDSVVIKPCGIEVFLYVNSSAVV
jgi:hypothetical protein